MLLSLKAPDSGDGLPNHQCPGRSLSPTACGYFANYYKQLSFNSFWQPFFAPPKVTIGIGDCMIVLKF
jgi:hypothetical protein